MARVLLTGSTGFVGAAVLAKLKELPEIQVVVTIRKARAEIDLNTVVVGDIDGNTDFSAALTDTDIVIHCAARAHIMHDDVADPMAEYRRVNVTGTMNLARQAARYGVKRFIFISSIKVNGESTTSKTKFTAFDIPAPLDAYGQSKAEAEQALLELSRETSMEVVIIRPTLVYGPAVKANFASLFSIVSRGIPLPFACICNNKRSLVSVTNLVDLIVTCIVHPKAANQIFLVSDGHDVSTSEMVREMATALRKPTWQIPIPVWIYALIGKLFRKSDIVDRLTGSLQVDTTHTKETLGWAPKQTLQEGFEKTAVAFLQSKNSR
ncbi:UDP-glucose 4-epimerase family protein [Aeromonas hydrophila]|uniref:UDP-glucose 4-epimerase family protein n=1 Tax=Aeromonas hydrophila TaxID=644 RepID=UPI001F331863|nr:SDR family oxidoreductase [Aeromonas hydrophila]BDC81681.1 UDP-glucose 4-epimerase [Aeromonas hydrophila]